MGSGRNWTQAEKDYLAENWGTVSVERIAENLNRSVGGVINMKGRMGLGAYLDSGDYITLNQLLCAFQGTNAGYSYKTISWVKKRGMPVHSRKVNKKRVKVVYLEEFWKWAEKNRSFLDFSKMQPLSLGEEPDWVEEQRKKDYYAFANQRKDPWTPGEDSRLKALLKQHKYGYAELSDMLHRSAGAIQRRINDLGLKERPVKAENHGKECEWTAEDFQLLADGIRNGDSYTEIGRAVGRSEKAVRGKVYTVYLTERADKVRTMLGDGSWGHGAPLPTVKQAACNNPHGRAMRKDMSALCGILRHHMNALGYDPYWQRFMCMKWDDLEGCTAGCTDCDACAEFVRIKPQYCVRCGATFYERQENKICKSCRAARKKAAQRKWSRINNRKGG